METVLLFMMYLVIFGCGVMFVVWGSNGVVMGAELINKMTKIPMFFIGLILVSLATTLPEFSVSLLSTIEGNVQLAIGNILGSNLFNIAGVLGLGAIIGNGIKSDQNIVWRHMPVAAISIVILGILCFDGRLSTLNGLILLGSFGVYLIYLYFTAKKEKSANAETHVEEEEGDTEPAFLTIFWTLAFKLINVFRKDKTTEIKPAVKLAILTVLGLGILIVGSKIMVWTAVSMATIAGLSEAFIGLTIVAIGTSMPELAVSIMAIIRKKKDLAIGNIIGANTMNALWALGLNSALIRPLPFNGESRLDIFFALGVSVLLWLFMFIGIKYRIERWQGVIFVVSYVGFVIIKFLMQNGTI
jgi:cation:H+ antiporter